MKLRCFCFLIALLPLVAFGQSSRKSLNGEWYFALDPVKIGEVHKWNNPGFPLSRWDKVTVPHSYTVDPRYFFYTGQAWYIKKISQLNVPAGYRAFLHFDAVFYQCAGWLNGKKVGEHEGGYTPFEWDITEALTSDNLFSLRVSNEWSQTTLPGAKTYLGTESENTSQLAPWINYGGITRNASIIIRPDVFIDHVKIVADPDLVKKTATLKMTVNIKNLSAQAATPTLVASIYHGGVKVPVKFKTSAITVDASGSGKMLLDGVMTAKDVKLWSPDDPVLYKAEFIAGKDTLVRNFGIRKLEIKGTKILLNGEPISAGGANRPLDHPVYGSMDPKEVLEKDLTLMKNAGMEFSRISHYPVSTELLNWADEHGLMIIAEAGNWQLTQAQMNDPLMRTKFKAQFREMIERDWNHPSVVAWSVGNEYPSNTPEGQAWTKDMYAFAKELDPSRMVTFASMFVGRDYLREAEEEASQYVDFISANIYGNHLHLIQNIHTVYPDKPVYISEFGIRTDAVKDENGRVEHLRKAMEDFRKCDYLVGACIWTFNDYRSRFPGTNANGYRPWGLVSPEREVRDMYVLWQEEFAPAIVETETSGSTVKVTITARKDFPSYTLRNYQVKAGNKTQLIDVLKPGQSKVLTFESAGVKEVSLLKPGGFTIVTRPLK